MISLVLALAAVEAPQARLDRVADQLRAGNAELCRANACPAPILAETIHCGFAKGFTVKIDPGCADRLNDDELAFVVAHEQAHVLGIESEAAADWVGWAMMLSAGFNPEQARRIFVTLRVPARKRLARIVGDD